MPEELNHKNSPVLSTAITAHLTAIVGTIVGAMFFVLSSPVASAQWTGLRVQGQQIVDQNGNNVILRGFGAGEMFNIEAYMLKWPDGNNGKKLWYYGHTRIHETIASLAGQATEQQFSSQWEANMVTDAEVAKWARWGVNSMRLSINYHWLSPANGTYLDTGWAKIDNFIGLCKKHNIKVILCLHAAPGAQNGELMSDTVDGTAHLWSEPKTYQPWTINLWQAIAQRYADEPSVAGYDLLDEPLTSESNTASGGATVRAFYVTLTGAIRKVDANHIIFACGTDYCSSVAGVKAILPPWDKNMVLVLHDYDKPFKPSTVTKLVGIRGRYNVPIWNGETGESSDAWAKQMVTALEANNIGWSWWTLKKVNNTTEPYSIPEPAKYGEILNYVNTFGSGKPPAQSDAQAVFLQLAANAAISQCAYNSGLITALFGSSK
jgi:Tfp pilus assembly protein PilX